MVARGRKPIVQLELLFVRVTDQSSNQNLLIRRLFLSEEWAQNAQKHLENVSLDSHLQSGSRVLTTMFKLRLKGESQICYSLKSVFT